MNLRDIKLRIRSVRKTQQITRAMKMVAAVKFRRAQARLLNARPYAARLREITARALGGQEANGPPHPLLAQRPLRRQLLLVVASDKGLCGSFNHNVTRAVQGFIREQAAAPETARADLGLWLVGRKINDAFKHFRSSGLKCAVARTLPQAEARSADLADQLGNLFRENRCDRVTAIYTEFKSAVQNRVVREPLLPLDAGQLAGSCGPRTWDPLAEPELPALLDDLLPRLLANRIRQILMESEAAEQGTRMSMMDQATKNADDLIGQLMQDYNKARQWNITRELTDLTTGVEAMG